MVPLLIPATGGTACFNGVLRGRVVRASDNIFLSQTSNLKIGGSFRHAITSCQFGFPLLCITYSIIIKGQFLSYHAYLVWEIIDPLSR